MFIAHMQTNKSYLLLKSRLIAKKYYIIVTSISSRYLANNFDNLKEHKSKVDLITVMRAFNPKSEVIALFLRYHDAYWQTVF